MRLRQQFHLPFEEQWDAPIFKTGTPKYEFKTIN